MEATIATYIILLSSGLLSGDFQKWLHLVQ